MSQHCLNEFDIAFRLVLGLKKREVAQLVSVRVWGARGRQFESGLPDQKKPFIIAVNGFFGSLS